MSDTTQLMIDTAERIFADLCTKEAVDAAEQGVWPTALWSALDENGLLFATVPEDAGGVGLPLADALALLRPAGRAATPLPLAEALLAGALLGEGGVAHPTGPLALAIPDEGDNLRATVTGETLSLSGTVAAVPWAQSAASIVAVANSDRGVLVALVDAAAVTIEPGRTLAGEPLDRLRFDAVPVPAGAWAPAAEGTDPFALAALSRSVLMAGALESILAMTVTYALDRRQFGRPIAEFQAIQQQLTVLAGETAAAIRASDAALEALGTPYEAVEIAAAKARIGEAAGLGGAIAHQIHGAMGFTYEHPLHQRTRRLWSWRDQYGNENHWNAELGRRIAAIGGDGIWAFVTRVA